MLEQAPFTVDIDWMVREVQQLGLNRNDNPGLNERRLFYESGKYVLKIWDGTEWDTLDFIRKGANDSYSGTLTSTMTSGVPHKFDNGSVLITVHDGYGDFNIKSSVNENHQIINNAGACIIRLDELGKIILAISTKAVGQTFTDDVYIQIDSNGVVINGKPVLRGDYANPSSIGSRIISSKTINNGSYENTGIPAGTAGFFMLKNETDGVAGYFSLCCSSSTDVDWTLGNSGGDYFAYSDTAGKLCVFFYNGTLQIRNRTGSTKVISAGFFKIG